MLGRYLCSFAAAATRIRVVSLTSGYPFSARLTVVWERFSCSESCFKFMFFMFCVCVARDAYPMSGPMIPYGEWHLRAAGESFSLAQTKFINLS